MSPLSQSSHAFSPDPLPRPEEIVELVAEPLVRVESCFVEHLSSPVSIVEELGNFVAEGQGKRVRPTLHLLTARLCGYSGPHDVVLGTVLEYIHSATLIHDDVIDNADTRRGRPAVHRTWGNNVSVLFGDYLLAKAMELALRAESLEVMERLAEVTLRMTEGEMLQTRFVGRLDLDRGDYFDLVERKTAALFRCCCELAGILAGASPKQRRSLADYGLNLGIQFQLVDDLLDLTGDRVRLGKPVASDLAEGKVTLAVLDLLECGDTEGRRLAEAIVASGRSDETTSAALVQRLEASGALQRAQVEASGFARRAVEAVADFPASPFRDALQALPANLLARDQ